MTERLKVHDWKSCGRVKLPRGFESLPLRYDRTSAEHGKQPTLGSTADIPDNLDEVAARYAAAAPRYGIQFLTD